MGSCSGVTYGSSSFPAAPSPFRPVFLAMMKPNAIKISPPMPAPTPIPAFAPVERPPELLSSLLSVRKVDAVGVEVGPVGVPVAGTVNGRGVPLAVLGSAPRNSKGRSLNFAGSLQHSVLTPQHHFRDRSVPSQGVITAPVVPFPLVQSSEQMSKHNPVFQSLLVHVSRQYEICIVPLLSTRLRQTPLGRHSSFVLPYKISPPDGLVLFRAQHIVDIGLVVSLLHGKCS